MIQWNKLILCAKIRSRSRSSAVTGRGGVNRGSEGVKVLQEGVNEAAKVSAYGRTSRIAYS